MLAGVWRGVLRAGRTSRGCEMGGALRDAQSSRLASIIGITQGGLRPSGGGPLAPHRLRSLRSDRFGDRGLWIERCRRVVVRLHRRGEAQPKARILPKSALRPSRSPCRVGRHLRSGHASARCFRRVWVGSGHRALSPPASAVRRSQPLVIDFADPETCRSPLKRTARQSQSGSAGSSATRRCTLRPSLRYFVDVRYRTPSSLRVSV